MQRRDFIRFSAGAVTAFGATAAVGGCAGVAATGAEAGAEAAFNPAVWNWLSDLAKSIAAAELTNFLNSGFRRASDYWRSWFDGVNQSAQNYDVYWDDCWGHTIPPVVLVQVTKGHVSKNYDGDPMRDGLLACVGYGNDAVYFEPWAWQALSMYVHYMTNGLKGQNLANAQAVCVAGLIPAGTRPKTGRSPENVVEWMTYDTRSGPVEIGKLQGSDGSYRATVKATGIWDVNQQPIVRQFTLPTAAA